MSDYRSIEGLRDQISMLDSWTGKRLHHRKSGNFYKVDHFFFKEDDMTLWFVYHPEHDFRIKFGRPLTELFDGRFEDATNFD